MDLVKSIITALWPPRAPSGDIFGRWRVSIAMATMANIAGITLGFALATGYIAFVYSGVASATDVKAETIAFDATIAKMTSILASLQRGQLDAKLRDIDRELVTDRMAICAAQRDKNLAAKAFAEQRFNQDYQNYYSLSGGVAWRIPDCSELI